MRYVVALVLLVGLGARAGLGQASEPSAAAAAAKVSAADAATLEAILTEVRGIHNDVRLSETTQILLTEMEVQRGVVDKAMVKRDTAKQRIQQTQDQEKAVGEQMARFDDNVNATIDPVQKKQLMQLQDQMKQQLAMLKAQEPERANDLTDAEIALRKEQDVLAGIQDQLNDVVKKLQP